VPGVGSDVVTMADGNTNPCSQICMPWRSSYDAASLNDTYYLCSKNEIFQILTQILKFDKKGNLVKAFRASLESDAFENSEMVSPVAVLAGVPAHQIDKLGKNLVTFEVTSRVNARKGDNSKVAAISSAAEQPAPESTPEAAGAQKDQDEESVRSFNDEALDQFRADISVAESEETLSEQDPTEQEEAIGTIHRAVRATKSRMVSEALRSRAVADKARNALVHDGVLDVTAEVLRNTIFNLVQEASYEEFSIGAEPLKFMVKK
jgi:hypothetical protein